MKKNFHSAINNQGNRKSFLRQFSIASSLAIVVIVVVLTFQTSLRGYMISMLSPIWKIEQGFKMGTARVFSSFSTSNLQKENEDLKSKLTSSEVKDSLQQALVVENRELKQVLGRLATTTASSTKLASILPKPNQFSNDTLLVDLGSEDGILNESLVVAYGNVPIGTITEVYSHQSLVTLFSAFNKKTKVLIGDKHLEAEAQGVGAGGFVLKLPKATEIKNGDVVTATNFITYVFGNISSIESVENNPFIEAHFSLFANPQELHFVQIIKN